MSLSPCRTDILARHLWGGRIEDACGEVTGHPFDEPCALILEGLSVGCLALVARLALQKLCVHTVLLKTCSLLEPQKDFEEYVFGLKLSFSARVAVDVGFPRASVKFWQHLAS